MMNEVSLLKLSHYVSKKEEFHYVFYDHFNPKKTIKHCHDYYEVMLVTENSVVHHVNDTRTELHVGNICFIRPDDIHYFSSYKRQVCSFINLSFRSRLINVLFDFLELDKYKNLLQSSLPPVVSVSPNKLAELKTQLSQLKRSDFDDVDALNLTAKVVLVNIFSLFYLNEMDDMQGYPHWLSKTMYLMQEEENFRGGIKRMQEIACVSPEHLSRVFRTYTQQTPGEFITKIRMKYAINLLVRTDTAITEIAMELGFSSVSHFYSVFKSQYQCTPLQYRKNGLIKHVAPS